MLKHMQEAKRMPSQMTEIYIRTNIDCVMPKGSIQHFNFYRRRTKRGFK